MARIRTIKPSFFRHHDIYLAETSSGLPLRLAFIGLLTVCDREGRFKWRPVEMKLDCLPYDNLDFAAVLDALVDAGFVVKYAIDGETYGVVPTFAKHQVLNSREAQSTIPAPVVDMQLQVQAPVTHVQDKEEGEREGKGKEGEGNKGVAAAFDFYNATAKKAGWPGARMLTDGRRSKLNARIKDAGGIENWCSALERAAKSSFLRGKNDRGWTADLDFFLQQSSFVKLTEGKYDDRKTKPPRHDPFAVK